MCTSDFCKILNNRNCDFCLVPPAEPSLLASISLIHFLFVLKLLQHYDFIILTGLF